VAHIARQLLVGQQPERPPQDRRAKALIQALELVATDGACFAHSPIKTPMGAVSVNLLGAAETMKNGHQAVGRQWRTVSKSYAQHCKAYDFRRCAKTVLLISSAQDRKSVV
jgi:uncharacterized protein (DUF2147 family)